jgi:hypothetical protein
VLALFGSLRAEILGGSQLFWRPSPKAVEKSSQWLSELDASAFADIEPAIRLACESVRSGADGWTGSQFADPNFLLGAVIAKWSALREALHGETPVLPEPRVGQSQGGRKQRGSYDANWRDNCEEQR